MSFLSHTSVPTPLGVLKAVATQKALCALLWENQSMEAFSKLHGLTEGIPPLSSHPVLDLLKIQIQEYFEKKRIVFTIPLELKGTEFQKKIWEHVKNIPFGKTSTYQEIALKSGFSPSHGRAVGMAMGRNPIPLLIPCHRVIGFNQKMRGFSGGIPLKEQLLKHEIKN